MKLFPLKFSHLAAGAAALVFFSISLFAVSDLGARAQAIRTIKLIVPFPPGGAIDVLARVVAEEVGQLQGRTIVIENRPGAGSEIGTVAVSRSVPDGNTLLMGSIATITLPHLRKVNYDLADLEPICNLASTPTVIVVNKNSGYQTLDDLFRAARDKPGELTYGSAPGSVLHIGFEMLAHVANIQMTFVPFGGTPPAVNALLGEHIVAAMVDYSAAAGQLQAGTLRALAVGSRKRIDDLPDVPTVAESGYKDYELELWYGPFAPAKTPTEKVSQLIAWFSQAMRVPEVKSKLAVQQISPVAMCGADFSVYVRKQFDEFGRAIREANIKVE